MNRLIWEILQGRCKKQFIFCLTALQVLNYAIQCLCVFLRVDYVRKIHTERPRRRDGVLCWFYFSIGSLKVSLNDKRHMWLITAEHFYGGLAQHFPSARKEALNLQRQNEFDVSLRLRYQSPAVWPARPPPPYAVV